MIDVTVDMVEGDPLRRALVLPGQHYSAQAPLLAFPARWLAGRGWTVETLRWGTAPPSRDYARKVQSDLVRGLRAARPRTSALVIAKSLGTLALSDAQRCGVAGVWLTPLLGSASADVRVKAAAAAIQAGSPPALFVGGTADPTWDPAVISPHAEVHSIDGADHRLEMAGDWRACADTLWRVMEAVEALVDRLA
jgi:hypothetical protein